MDCQIHRWRYSLASERYHAPFIRADNEHPPFFGGDGFGMGNVEGGFLSGLAMAEVLL
jgi:predicted NAD/FAD-dependent oxidoreductase